MAGYSNTPLGQKLGIKPGSRVILSGAPTGFAAALGRLPEGTVLHHASSSRGSFDVAVVFTKSLADLVKRFGGLQKRMAPAAGLWIAWPKRASGVETDLTEDVVRRVALERSLVDNKVCAIDDTWSGLRLVIRVADRAKTAPARSTRVKPARKTRAPRRQSIPAAR
jgi:hypothetical protein